MSINYLELQKIECLDIQNVITRYCFKPDFGKVKFDSL